MLRRLHGATFQGENKMTTAAPTRANFQGTTDALREHRPRITASLERLDLPEGGPHRLIRERLLQMLETSSATTQHAAHAAILANMFEVVARGDAEDYAEAARLFRLWGKRVSRIQDEFEDRLGLSPNRPYTTAAILRLARGEHIRRLLVDAGHPHAEAERIAAECGEIAVRLLLEASTRPVPRLCLTRPRSCA